MCIYSTARGVNTCVGVIYFRPSIPAAKLICKVKSNIVPGEYFINKGGK